MPRLIKLTPLALVLVAVGGPAYLARESAKDEGGAGPAPAAAAMAQPAMPVIAPAVRIETESVTVDAVGGKAQLTEVRVGSRISGKVEIKTGLTQGEVLMTEGQTKLRDGAAIGAVAPVKG